MGLTEDRCGDSASDKHHTLQYLFPLPSILFLCVDLLLSEGRPSMKGMRNPPPGLEQSCELSPSVSLQGMTGHTLIPGERKGETRAGWVCSEINRVWYQVPFSLSVLSDNQEYVRTHTPTIHIRSPKFQRKQHFYHNNKKKRIAVTGAPLGLGLAIIKTTHDDDSPRGRPRRTWSCDPDSLLTH